MGLTIRNISNIIVLCGFILGNHCFAAWNGPSEVITSTWGSDVNQFYFYQGDSEDYFPDKIDVDINANIYINDKGNKRVKMYTPDGKLKVIIIPPNDYTSDDDWPNNISVHPFGGFVADYDVNDMIFYDAKGNTLNRIKANIIYGMNENGYIIGNVNEPPKQYSLTGNLLSSNATDATIWNKYNVIDSNMGYLLNYNGFKYIIPENVSENIVRDLNKNLYVMKYDKVNGNRVITVNKYNICGKYIASGNVPSPVDYEITEYGQPVIAPNGDIFVWKRTSDTYSVLKWSWQDEPNAQTCPQACPDAPTNLKISALNGNLTLTWALSPQDPGCVTGYEISRSDKPDGTFSVLTTVAKGVLTFTDTTAQAGITYYYKIRAVADNLYSPYTDVVNGVGQTNSASIIRKGLIPAGVVSTVIGIIVYRKYVKGKVKNDSDLA